METIKCTVKRITYQNNENGYSVLKCQTKGFSELITVVGCFYGIKVESCIKASGIWEWNKKYSSYQFESNSFIEELPSNISSMTKYLGSGAIKGIGPVLAKRITKKFKLKTYEILDQSPERLLEIDGIGKLKLAKITKSWNDTTEIRQLSQFLQQYNISTSYAAKIYHKYKDMSMKILRENPYQLTEDIWGIGFKTADEMAQKLGISKNSSIRIESGIKYVLNTLSNQGGHCFATQKQLIDSGKEILDVDEKYLTDSITKMISNKKIIDDNGDIYLPVYYYAEVSSAKKIKQLMNKAITPVNVEKSISSLTGEITYHGKQLEAIKLALTSKFMVLTGGPGTGKTTTLLGIIHVLEFNRKEILLTAPTGRAAKRMSEATGKDAITIHRLLKYENNKFTKDQHNPLEGDVLIIDECSMIDILLMNSLLKAIPENMIVIMVGDVNQLPSVGAGNVLKDIISSETVPVIELTEIRRQAAGSRIITNAHLINEGKWINDKNGDTDFFFIEKNENVMETLLTLATKNLPKYYKKDPIKDIQILAPMRKGDLGIHNLNFALQEILNKNSEYIQYGVIKYKVGDKVMQLKNNYEKNVFNGDVGYVCRVNTEDNELMVDYDGTIITYESKELEELSLAYAITIHKSQGSEYPIVVMPITTSHWIMLQRNLLYTGVTRAKQILVLIGSKKAVERAIKNNVIAARNSKLEIRLKE